MEKPVLIKMHPNDNVAIVANDFGLPEGTTLPDGLVLRDRIPQGHKFLLVDLAAGEVVRRYDVPIGYAVDPLPAGSWVSEHVLTMPPAPKAAELPIATNVKSPGPALE
ncbi:MAG TPA: UxaA family hydrolase, partial [Paracoccaceae bacterium]|nr:UxaA family hydrolase [Paracoccaceae bacterium]